jgi:N-acetylglucosaminyl-diphospho-decaprenol L-rhamnosyltransferase
LNPTNVGYGRAMNQGVRASTSHYVCILNTDLILNAEALTSIWRHMELSPATGVCSPVICHSNGRMQGFTYAPSWCAQYSDFCGQIATKLTKLHIARAKEPVSVAGVMGAFIFLRRDLIEDGTLFDEDFFFYYEDTDLARRLWKGGVRCDVLPGESIVHLVGKSSSSKNYRLFHASKYLFVRKHFGLASARLTHCLDRWKFRRKLAVYQLLALFLPTTRVRGKLSSYREGLRALQGISKEYGKL